MDVLLLEYKLKAHGVSREALASAQGWSSSTTTRRLTGQQTWLVSEVNKLLEFGFTPDELVKIFFNEVAS